MQNCLDTLNTQHAGGQIKPACQVEHKAASIKTSKRDSQYMWGLVLVWFNACTCFSICSDAKCERRAHNVRVWKVDAGQ